MLNHFVGYLASVMYNLAIAYRSDKICKLHGFKGVRLGNVVITGNIKIGPQTYVNSGRIVSGSRSKVVIGKRCNIGYNVLIAARTHPKEDPTNPSLPRKEADIIIGDRVWIGANVVIREGITIGDDAIIGANSVVTHDVEPNQMVGGVPARPLRRARKIAYKH